MIKKQILLNTVENVNRFSAIVSKFNYDIDLSIGRYVVDAKSIIGIFGLNLSKELTLTTHSDNAYVLLEAINDYIV